MAEKLCPACCGAGEKTAGDGSFRVRTVCRTCHGECYLPENHPAFAATVVSGPSVTAPIES